MPPKNTFTFVKESGRSKDSAVIKSLKRVIRDEEDVIENSSDLVIRKKATVVFFNAKKLKDDLSKGVDVPESDIKNLFEEHDAVMTDKIYNELDNPVALFSSPKPPVNFVFNAQKTQSASSKKSMSPADVYRKNLLSNLEQQNTEIKNAEKKIAKDKEKLSERELRLETQVEENRRHMVEIIERKNKVADEEYELMQKFIDFEKKKQDLEETTKASREKYMEDIQDIPKKNRDTEDIQRLFRAGEEVEERQRQLQKARDDIQQQEAQIAAEILRKQTLTENLSKQEKFLEEQLRNVTSDSTNLEQERVNLENTRLRLENEKFKARQVEREAFKTYEKKVQEEVAKHNILKPLGTPGSWKEAFKVNVDMDTGQQNTPDPGLFVPDAGFVNTANQFLQDYGYQIAGTAAGAYLAYKIYSWMNRIDKKKIHLKRKPLVIYKNKS
jgi:hypothetical protein